MRRPLDRHLLLLHRLEKRRLRLRRRPVDLVGEHDVREDRPSPELEVGGSLVEDRRPGDVPGHQIGCELDAREAHRGHLRKRAGDQRLGQAREILDQDVSVREYAEQDELERVALADDRAFELGQDLLRLRGELLDRHSRSSRSTCPASSATGSPGAVRLPTSRSGETSSQSSSPRSCLARSGSRSRSTAWRP